MPVPLKPGLMIDGFELIAPLHEGGMATLWRVTHPAHGMPLLLHGEVTDPAVDIFDRERVFIDTILVPLVARFPALRVVRLEPRRHLGAALGRDERLAHADGPRSVLHVGHGQVVFRIDLHGRVRRGGGCAADQQRHLEALPLHLPGDVHHLVE